jgi:hypothetical protein
MKKIVDGKYLDEESEDNAFFAFKILTTGGKNED